MRFANENTGKEFYHLSLFFSTGGLGSSFFAPIEYSSTPFFQSGKASYRSANCLIFSRISLGIDKIIAVSDTQDESKLGLYPLPFGRLRALEGPVGRRAVARG